MNAFQPKSLNRISDKVIERNQPKSLNRISDKVIERSSRFRTKSLNGVQISAKVIESGKSEHFELSLSEYLASQDLDLKPRGGSMTMSVLRGGSMTCNYPDR